MFLNVIKVTSNSIRSNTNAIKELEGLSKYECWIIGGTNAFVCTPLEYHLNSLNSKLYLNSFSVNPKMLNLLKIKITTIKYLFYSVVSLKMCVVKFA